MRLLTGSIAALALCLAGAMRPAPATAQAVDGAEAAPGERPAPEETLQATAVLFFHALREGLPASVVAFCDTPFVLDGEAVRWRKSLEQAFEKRLARTDLSLLRFDGVRLLTPQEMEARHGAPPERLGDLDLEGAWVAVANFGGQGHVAVFRQVRGRWLAVAYSD